MHMHKLLKRRLAINILQRSKLMLKYLYYKKRNAEKTNPPANIEANLMALD